MGEVNPIEGLLKRDRALVIGALSLIIFLSWLYVLTGAGMGTFAFDMSSLSMALGETDQIAADGSMLQTMGGAMAAMARPADWTFGYAIFMFFMWWIMMVAMMLPSAAPMILLHAMVNRKARARTGEPGNPWPTASFTLGYLLAWAAFSVIAAALQWTFEEAGLLSPMMMNGTSTLFAGTILVLAGLYQLTPIKQACLKHCRGPISFLSHHWRPGSGGALVMGLHHGAYCLGCCWGLMAILFFGGIMNLYWITGLALIVLLEKLLPLGRRLSLITGGLLLVWGVSFLYRALE
jgi:predicted metal-binding membrane protein